MKKITALLAVLGIMVTVFPAYAAKKSTAKDEMAIKAVFDKFADAWVRGDAHARAMLWDEKGTLINPMGMRAEGQEAIEKLFAEENKTIANGTVHTFSNYGFRFITAKIVFVDVDLLIRGVKTPDGKAAPDLKGHAALLFTKGKSGWSILDARAAIFPPAPESMDKMDKKDSGSGKM